MGDNSTSLGAQIMAPVTKKPKQSNIFSRKAFYNLSTFRNVHVILFLKIVAGVWCF